MSKFAISLHDVVSDPHWFPTDFDLVSETISFIRTTREDIIAQPFLDTRWKRDGLQFVKAPFSALLSSVRSFPQPLDLCFIWHTGFCCSTLLADALEKSARNLSLCEPKILVDIADAKRAFAFSHGELARLPDTSFKLLSRSFGSGEAITVKPAPAANCLLPEAMALPGSKHLVLYSDCREFILSIAKYGSVRGSYVRNMLRVMIRNQVSPHWDEKRISSLSPLRASALLWHLQIAEIRNHFNSEVAGSLDCDFLLAEPLKALSAVTKIFDLKFDNGELAQIVEGPKFRRNAKSRGEEFGADSRLRLHEEVEDERRAEIDEAVAWSYEVFPATPSNAAPLPNALHVPIDKAYHP